MNNRQLALVAVLGGVLVLGFRAVNAANEPATLPPPPPPTNNTSNSIYQWLAWAQLASKLFGDIAALWAPGGPFYGMSTEEVYDQVPDEVLDEWNWNDPNDYPQGWV